MKSFLLCGIAIASVLMLQPAPASAQRVHGGGQAHIGHGYAGHGAGRFQYHHGGYAHGYGPGYGINRRRSRGDGGANRRSHRHSEPRLLLPDQNYPGYSNPGYVYSDASPAAYNNGDFVAYCEQTYRYRKSMAFFFKGLISRRWGREGEDCHRPWHVHIRP